MEEAHTVLASDFINEQLAKIAGIPEEQMGLGHAFEIDPDLEHSFLYELAQAQMIREIFPNAPLKYMPPTKFMTGNIFKGHIQDALFNLAGIWTEQGIQLLGMPTEAIHTPFMSDRYLAIENARYIFSAFRGIGKEVAFAKDGIIRKERHRYWIMHTKCWIKWKKKACLRPWKKVFADVRRPREGGKGLDGVTLKSPVYLNRMWNCLKEIKNHDG